jgi:hypothetical protein
LTDVGKFKDDLEWAYSDPDEGIQSIGRALDLMGSLPSFPLEVATQVAKLMARYRLLRDGRAGVAEESLIQAGFARCILGNPFRPVTFDPRWRSADTVALARGIYEDRAFDRLLLLADALMDAGCDDEQVIGHCRSEGPHVRGCWVVDSVLGKE